MRIYICLLFAAILATGCSNTPEKSLTQSPVEVEVDSLDAYWVLAKSTFRFPVDPSVAKRSEGFVRVKYLIDSNGRVFDPEIIASSPPGTWNRTALKALSYHRYVPAESNPGKAPVYVVNTIRFN